QRNGRPRPPDARGARRRPPRQREAGARKHARALPAADRSHRADASDPALAAQSVHQAAGEPLVSSTVSAGNRIGMSSRGTEPAAAMKTWTTETWVRGTPEEVLELLTEPDAIARWAPIPFEVLDLDGERIVAGTRARVGGALAGRRLEFDVE